MKKIIMGLMIAITLTGIIALNSETYATLTASDSVTNVFDSGSVEISVNENGFTDKTDWDGSKTEKVVQITNESKNPALIRVAVIPRWVDESGNPWPGDTSIVEIEFDNITNDANDTGSNQEGRWIRDGELDDERYYYTSIVPTGGDTVSIIKSVSATIPDELKTRYAGKKLVVDVKSEAVLAAGDSDGVAVYKKTWTDVKDKNIEEMLNLLSGIE